MKNKKIIFLILILSIVNLTSFACDICGCYMGIVPNENKSSIAVYYRYRAFTGKQYSGNDLFPDGGNLRVDHASHTGSPGSMNMNETFEVYRVAELRMSYYLHPRLEMNIILPYSMNMQSSGTQSLRINGVGDASIMGSWRVFDNSLNLPFRQYLQLGTGIKLPLGNNNKKLNNIRLDYMLQTGTGTTDGFIFFNYMLGWKSFGLGLNASYKVNGTNNFNERFSNSSTANLNLFYKWSINENLKLLPIIKSYYEFSNGTNIDKSLQNGTSMNVLMFGGGFDIYYKSIGLSISSQIPLVDEVDKNGMKSTLRSVLGLTWNFSQNKYLFNRNSENVE